MTSFDPLLLDVWREVSRHTALDESLARMMSLLVERLPLGELMIRAIDAAGGFLETTVVESARGGRPAPLGDAKTVVAAGDLERLLEWGRLGEPAMGDDRAFRKRFPGLAPEKATGHLLAAPLNAAEGEPAVLILAADPPRVFEPRHEALVRALIDPLTVAVENDNRLRELVMLREAVEAENRSLRSRLDRNDISGSIIGAETGLREVMEQIDLVTLSDAPVLILGETGSGKEVVARAIHTRSRRSTGPFLRVNCGAIPSELVDSELFGHERGSFTGAVGERKGWFERADGGTLFLDECGELPPAAQVRLLRILQDGQFERVGGEKARHVDIRIIAATHRDLQAMTVDGRFRQDLWYRLAVFPIHLPPLRERLSDISALAAHFAIRAAGRLGVPQLLPTADDVGLLVQYSWPGNVRELAAVIERAAILGSGTGLDVARALGLPARGLAQSSAPPKLDAASPVSDGPLPTLDQAAARHIELALSQCGGRIEGPAGAAARLGVNPHTLRSRMRKLGVDWNKFRPATVTRLGHVP
ncbi:MAG: sigma 54-interacting transcriptional regulator [Paludisphaera borealis]|uniref:sigma-54 interaction domain-containing protein n=1 Tax=Paludisphaera borealis TaxID=1387353 RepID=UPI00284D27E6|nr:sigma 54-interacting transcriptional regulator [Paludisphaera borealis]MDR3619650.1 sigma 54-interacting transcriptional regulator [Paludisphaera borealis]